MLLAQPVRRELVFGLELFAANAVQARVSVLVDVPVVVDPLDELLDEAVVTLIGRAYEEVGSCPDARRRRRTPAIAAPAGSNTASQSQAVTCRVVRFWGPAVAPAPFGPLAAPGISRPVLRAGVGRGSCSLGDRTGFEGVVPTPTR